MLVSDAGRSPPANNGEDDFYENENGIDSPHPDDPQDQDTEMGEARPPKVKQESDFKVPQARDSSPRGDSHERRDRSRDRSRSPQGRRRDDEDRGRSGSYEYVFSSTSFW